MSSVEINALEKLLTLAIIFLTIFGWLTGVAINHAANILPTRTTLFQQPRCRACGTIYTPMQWSALAAKFTRRQTCSQCGVPQPRFARSIVVEVTLPLLFLFLLWRFGLTPYMGLMLLYTAILALVTVTDLEHRLIFNVIILPSILLAVAAAFLMPDVSWRAAVVGGVGAFVLVYAAAWLSRGGLGEGDVTLSTFLGFAMGFPKIILSLTFGVFLGGFVALLLLVTGKVGLKSFIPYGPFLTVTGWVMLVWGNEIWQHYFF